MKPLSALVILPTYNEAECIVDIIPAVLDVAAGLEVLVVDDNSPDETAKIVRETFGANPRVHLLNRERKEGLGFAYNAGFAWAIERAYDVVVQMDADFSHRPQDLKKLLEAVGEGADLAVGTRYIDGGSTKLWSTWRRWISLCGNWYARFMLGTSCVDMTTGFNAWRTEILRLIQFSSIRSKGYAYQVEIKWRAHLVGAKIEQVPIQFDPRRAGYSKMSFLIVHEAATRVYGLRRERTTLLNRLTPKAVPKKHVA